MRWLAADPKDMKTTTGARKVIRTGMLLLLVAGLAACSPTPATRTPSPSAPGAPSSTSTTSTTPTPVATTSPIPAAPGTTDGWLSFHSTAGKLSFLYDPTWTPVQCPPDDSPLIVLGLNICGQIEPTFAIDSVQSAQAPPAPDLRCDGSQPRAVSSRATVDGVTGIREYIDHTTAAYDNCRHPVMHALAYFFYTVGRAYTITYLYIPSDGADQTSNVDRMVQTLTFSAS
jgi:hypothetical protein